MTDDSNNVIGNSIISGKKVIIVEDDVFLGRLLQKHLTQDGMKATLIDTGEGAFDRIKENIPQVLVLDIFLPGMNGLDLLDLLRKDEATKNIPVLVVSNTDQAKDRERAKNLNALFLTKVLVTPMSIVEYVKKIFTQAK